MWLRGARVTSKKSKQEFLKGSRLGPLLWILYVNDIIEEIESEICRFDNDTCIFASAEDPAETSKKLNKDLEKINAWARKWKVTFNPGKSKDLIFSERKYLFNSPPIIFNDTFVDRVHEHKHLGVWLCSNLSWSRQVHETCIKANGKLAVLRNINFLNRSTLDLLYKLTVRSIIDYGLPLYFNTLKETDKARLNRIQYRAAKICTGALHLSSSQKLENDLAWESISDRSDFLGISLFHKIHLHQTRPLIRNCMPEIMSERSTRSSGNYKCFPYNYIKFSQSFFPYFTKCWNNLNKNLKSEQDMEAFKNKLKLKIKPIKYKHFNFGNKKGCSLMTRLRIQRSELLSHAFSINLSETDLCDTCLKSENNSHYLLHCDKYLTERQILFGQIVSLVPNFLQMPDYSKVLTLLHGINLQSDIPDCRNKSIFLAVQTYIFKTNRFQ